MKKIANTVAGTVIVEISQEHFEALQKIITPKKGPPTTGVKKTMTKAELIDYVSVRLNKLRPRKLPGVEKSISAMFNFTGGIDESEIKAIIAELKKKKLLIVDNDGKVSYPGEN